LIVDTPATKTKNVIFENITQDEIASSSTSSSGSGGPTKVDMQTWTEMICSKSYGRDEHRSGLEPILARSGLDRTAIFLKIGRSGLDRTEKKLL